MYLIKGTGVSFRLSEEEIKQLNQTAQVLQDGNQTFTSSKQFIITLANEFLAYDKQIKELSTRLKEETERYDEQIEALNKENETLQNELNTLQDTQAPTTDLQPTFTDGTPSEPLKTNVEPQSEDEPTNKELAILHRYEKLIELIGYQDEPTEEQLLDDVVDILSQPEPEPQTVEVVVEKERELSENEFLLQLEPPQTNLLEKIARWRYQTKKDPQRLQTPQLIKRIVFNKGTLFNWHGEFETGISESRLKKQS